MAGAEKIEHIGPLSHKIINNAASTKRPILPPGSSMDASLYFEVRDEIEYRNFRRRARERTSLNPIITVQQLNKPFIDWLRSQGHITYGQIGNLVEASPKTIRKIAQGTSAIRYSLAERVLNQMDSHDPARTQMETLLYNWNQMTPEQQKKARMDAINLYTSPKKN